MTNVMLAGLLVLAAPVDVELEGVITLSRAPGGVTVVLKQDLDEPSVRLMGDKIGDLRKLQSAKVRVRGKQDGKKLQVEGYDLLSVYGKTPIVGQITEISGKIALVDGDGPAILLNLAPRSYKRFLEAQGVDLAWRPTRLLPDDFCWEFCDDDGLQLDFALGAGSYATALLAEFVHYTDGSVKGGTGCEQV